MAAYRPFIMGDVADHCPLAGLYSSAVLEKPVGGLPISKTLPLGRSRDVGTYRATAMEPVGTHEPVDPALAGKAPTNEIPTAKGRTKAIRARCAPMTRATCDFGTSLLCVLSYRFCPVPFVPMPPSLGLRGAINRLLTGTTGGQMELGSKGRAEKCS